MELLLAFGGFAAFLVLFYAGNAVADQIVQDARRLGAWWKERS